MEEKQFIPGMHVRINSDLSTTKVKYNLDYDGEMKSMAGNIFEVASIQKYSVMIKGPKTGYEFTFSIKDVEPVYNYNTETPNKVVSPLIFDPKNLDI